MANNAKPAKTTQARTSPGSDDIIDKKVMLTIKLLIQLAIVARPTAMLLSLKGYISELTVQGVDPMPMEKNATYVKMLISAHHLANSAGFSN